MNDDPGSTLACPLCGGSLQRVRRRLADRLWSLIRPVRRYRCDNPACGWVGNIARKRRR